MTTFFVEHRGSGDALRLGDMRDPERRDNDVPVQVRAAGVNPPDAKIRDGAFKRGLPYRLPLIPGNDVAGIVPLDLACSAIGSVPSRTSSQSTRTMSQSSRGGEPGGKRLASPWSV